MSKLKEVTKEAKKMLKDKMASFKVKEKNSSKFFENYEQIISKKINRTNNKK